MGKVIAREEIEVPNGKIYDVTNRDYLEDAFSPEMYDTIADCEICGDPIDYCIGHGEI